METFVLNQNNLSEVAEAILSETVHSKIILLKGELGSGKTTLAKLLIKRLGVNDIITSPTFNIVSEYCSENGQMVYHFDLYRIKSIEELYGIGFEEYMDSGNICIIEWPEIAEPLLAVDRIEVSISLMKEARNYNVEMMKFQ